MSDEELKAELERLRNENAALKKGASSNIRMKVSEKGAVSIKGERLNELRWRVSECEEWQQIVRRTPSRGVYDLPLSARRDGSKASGTQIPDAEVRIPPPQPAKLSELA